MTSENPNPYAAPKMNSGVTVTPPEYWLLRNISAVILGWLIGSIVNFTIVSVGMAMAPLPGVTDPNNMDQFKTAMSNMEFKHAVGPFLAHAMGTLVGSCVAALIAATRKKAFAFFIGGFFLLGGIIMCFLIPAPTWFIALDLIGAYFPMAWIATLLFGGSPKPANAAA